MPLSFVFQVGANVNQQVIKSNSFQFLNEKIIKSMIVNILLITFYNTRIKLSMMNKSIIDENKNIVKGTNTRNHEILDPLN